MQEYLKTGSPKELLRQCAGIVDPVIKKLLVEGVSVQTRPLLLHQVNTGGKRVRPALAMVSCLACGGKIKDVLYPAAALEILHTYTLIIDDIIDHSDRRRNRPTLWAQYGKSMAECASIHYAATVFQATNHSSHSTRLVDVFARSMKAIVHGEILDILYEQAGREEEAFVVQNRVHNVSPQAYVAMVSKKTASLLAASCELGSICAGGNKEMTRAMLRYGTNAGIAFQIRDDILDIFGDGDEFGKTIGKDIVEKKGGNVLVVYALENLPRAKQTELMQILQKQEVAPDDVSRAVELISLTDGLQKATRKAQAHLRQAKSALKDIPSTQWKSALSDLADFIVQRNA